MAFTTAFAPTTYLPVSVRSCRYRPPRPTATVSRIGSAAVPSSEDRDYLPHQVGACTRRILLTPDAPSGWLRLSAFLRVTPQSFLLRSVVSLSADGFTSFRAPVPRVWSGPATFVPCPPSVAWPPCSSAALRPHPDLALTHRSAASSTTTESLSPLSRLPAFGPFSLWNSRLASRRTRLAACSIRPTADPR